MPNEELFAFAGLYSPWVDKETGEIKKTYTILATEANPLLAEIHNNKKFALCAHLVDQLAETTFYNQGLEYYEGGLNIAFAQSLYLQSHLFESKSEYTDLLVRFQKMIRSKDSESIDFFLHISKRNF